MKAEEFRRGREEVERILAGVEDEIAAKFVLEPEKKIEQAMQIIDGLAKEASGEIQTRSVHNMSMKIDTLEKRIEKLPVKKKTAKKRAKKK